MFEPEETHSVKALVASMRAQADMIEFVLTLEDKDQIDEILENCLEIIGIQASVIEKFQATVALKF